jgi:hypothetical protein
LRKYGSTTGRTAGFPLFLITVLFNCLPIPAQNNTDWPEQLPVNSDTWVASDALGRTLPGPDECGPPREHRYVGMFYFVWQGAHNASSIIDITELLRQNPENPAYGPSGFFHWWGEPEAGYFRADDPWVIRRNLHMLIDAGIDVIFFDVTNAFTYLNIVKKICETAMSIRAEGHRAPFIGFLTNANSTGTITGLYNDFYGQNLYPELWFRWQGKPLMLGKTDGPNQEIRNFFTFRYSWAWTDTRNNPGHWQWLDTYPQDYGWVQQDVPEEIPVSVANHPADNGIGSSYHDGSEPPRDRYHLTEFTGQGLQFAEQWSRALEVDPFFVFVTGWNEWIAQRQEANASQSPSFLGLPTQPGDPYFVDCYNQEYMRDIEPMKDGHSDNYYYQLVANVRRYKGVRLQELATPGRIIDIDGSFSDWDEVRPVFHDIVNDVTHRDWPRYDGQARYVNTTGRNDFTRTVLTYDDDNIYFLIETAEVITPHTGSNWMLVFMDTDRNKSTGWEGYDYALNMEVPGSTETTLKIRQNGSWQTTAALPYLVNGNRMELAVPRAAIDQTGTSISFYFHLADNIQQPDDISEFFLNGDSAPNRRFNYHYYSDAASSVRGDGDEVETLLKLFFTGSGKVKGFRYSLPAGISARYSLYDLKGKLIGSTVLSQVSGTVLFDCILKDRGALSEGIYLGKMEINGAVISTNRFYTF